MAFNVKDDAISNIIVNNIEDSVRDTGTFVTADIQTWFREVLKIDVESKYIENVLLNLHRMFGQIVSLLVTAFFTSIALQISGYFTALFAGLKIKDRAFGVFRRAVKIFGKNSGRAFRSGQSLYTEEEVYTATRRCNTFLYSVLPNDKETFALPALSAVGAVASIALPALVGGDFEEARNARELFMVLKSIPETSTNLAHGFQNANSHTGLVAENLSQNGISKFPKSDKSQQNIMAEIRQFFEELRNTRMMGG